MSTARLQQTATLLANGDVLVVGGFGPPGPSQQSASLRPNEVYDPATNTWTPEASMATARYGHIATLSRQWRAPGGGRPQPVRVVELDALVRRAISAQLGFPTITATAPTASPVGKTVTIRGWLFGTAMSVRFDGVAASFTFVSDTKITAKVPLGTLTGPISVTTPVGTAWSPANFMVRPTVTGFSPKSGPAGTVVTISGTAFTGAATVEFNGSLAKFKVKLVRADHGDGPKGCDHRPHHGRHAWRQGNEQDEFHRDLSHPV